MHSQDPLAAALRSVVAIRYANGTVAGTGVVVAADSVLTALHVVSDQAASSLRVADGTPVTAVQSLPTRRFGHRRRQAKVSHRRSVVLTGEPSSTVDVALLTVPGLALPAAPVRRQQVTPGERVVIAGYPNGEWTVSVGPVTSTDKADYVARVLLGPGSSGAPAFDAHGQVCGLLSLDHLSAGAIVIGPGLLSEFVHRTQPCPWCTQ